MTTRSDSPGQGRPQPGPARTPRPRPRPDARSVDRPRPTAALPAVAPAVMPSRRAALIIGVSGLIAVAGLAPGNGLEAITTSRADSPRGPVAAPDHATSPEQGGAAARPVAAHRGSVHRHRGHPIRRLDDVGHAGPAGHRALFAPRAIMLTLDDGPHPVWTPRMLALLEHAGVTATFFMIGSQVHRHPGLVREVVARGHVVGNHTWTHDEQLTLRPAARIRSEIDRTSHAIHAAAGVVPTQFRAPGGNWGNALLDVLADKHLVPVGWSVDPTDWARPGTKAITRQLLRARPHDIALCHDGGGDRSQTYHALATVIPRLKQRGYSFVTLPARLPQALPATDGQ